MQIAKIRTKSLPIDKKALVYGSIGIFMGLGLAALYNWLNNKSSKTKLKIKNESDFRVDVKCIIF